MLLRERKRNRLKHFNYSDAGWYFVTICTQDRQHLFGNIINHKMILNTPGLMTNIWLNKIEEKYNNVYVDIYQIMPNHIHVVIVINNKKSVGDDLRVVPIHNNYQYSGGHTGPPLQNQRQQQLLFQIIRWFKTMTTNEYIRNVYKRKFPKFNKRLWQRSFYDRIIRNEHELNILRQYIKNNPRNWEEERNNVENLTM